MLIVAEDVAEGFVYESDGVVITPFEVDHAPVEPAFGYRIDYRGRSVVLSGDTRLSENLIRRAEGVDLLIHEVAAIATHLRAGMAPAVAATITAHHTSPEQAGRSSPVPSRSSPSTRTSVALRRPSRTRSCRRGRPTPARSSSARI